MTDVNGTNMLRERIGKGTKFIISLPVAQKIDMEEKLKIFLVKMMRISGMLLRNIFRAKGFDTDLFSTGKPGSAAEDQV